MKMIFVLSLFFIFSGIAFSAEGGTEGSQKILAGFDNESRAGIIVTNGNTKTQTLDLSQKDSYEWNSNKAGVLGTFLRSSSKGVESAKRWSLGLRYDRILADRWSIFVAQVVEGDTYSGILQRYSSDAGGKYQIIKEERNQWLVEAGYRFQHENQTSGDKKNTSFARLYSSYEHLWNPTVSSKLWAEYLQSFTVANDRFINAEISTRAALTAIFSLQLAYLVKHRQLPPNGVVYKTDTTLSAALIAQF